MEDEEGGSISYMKLEVVMSFGVGWFGWFLRRVMIFGYSVVLFLFSWLSTFWKKVFSGSVTVQLWLVIVFYAGSITVFLFMLQMNGKRKE